MADDSILPVADVKRHLPRLGDFLSKADYDRLAAILPFFKPQQASKAPLSACLDAVATGRTTQEKMADFRAFRQRLRQAARKAGLGLPLEVDSKKRSQPQGRLCWFTQPSADRISESVAAFSEGVIASLDTTTTIQSRAMVSVAPRRVRFFVSYDRDHDQQLGKNLLDRLQLNFQVSKDYEYDIWDESAILVGEHRANAIAEARHKADFGLLLVSVAWLAKFEPVGDLSVFVTDDGKPVIPVVLRNVDEDRHQLHGLELRQLFRLESPRGARRSFAACRSDEERDRFAQSLFRQIEQRLQRWMVARSIPPSQPSLSQVTASRGTIDEAIDPDAHAGVRTSDYCAWVLLPFNEDQIREYLSAVLGPAHADDALALFARVHNLRELAERPYLLALIAERIGELEARQARNKVVRGSTLYGLLAANGPLAEPGGAVFVRYAALAFEWRSPGY